MVGQQVPVWLEPIWEQWRTAFREGRLPHAILVTGPSGIGKRWLVEAFVRGVQCRAPTEQGLPCETCPSCKQYVSYRRLETKSHPDIDWLTIGRYSIGIGDIRDQIIRRLTLKANYGRMRLLVIEPAERMTHSASNALLKSLEEPPPDTVLFLISHQPGRLLATIRSRCQKYVIQGPTPEQGQVWLSGFMTPEQAESALEAGGGMPMRALQMQQEGQVDFRDRFEQDLAEVLAGGQLETAFASAWNIRPAREQGRARSGKKANQVEGGAQPEDIPMDLRLVWMIDRVVAEVRKRVVEKGSLQGIQAAVRAYQELLEIRAREASIPAPQLNLEAACLALAKMSRAGQG